MNASGWYVPVMDLLLQQFSGQILATTDEILLEIMFHTTNRILLGFTQGLCSSPQLIVTD